MRKATISIAARLTLGFIALFAAAHIGICFYLVYALRAELLDQDRRELSDHARFIGQLVAKGRSLQEVESDPRFLEASVLHPRLDFALHDAREGTIGSSSNLRWLLDGAAAARPTAVEASDLLKTVVHEGRVWRALVSQVNLDDRARTPVTFVVGLDVTEREELAWRYHTRLAVVDLVAVIVAAVIGLPLVRSALTPLRTMAQRAGAISAARLGERLPEDGVPSELLGLSAAFNQTLGRLEDSFRRLSQFSSDLAHDLRTPIGNLMGEAQVALRRERTPEEYRSALASTVEECERLTRMIEDMLFLARADNAQAALRCAPQEAADEVGRVAAYYEGLLAEQGLALTIRGAAVVWADPQLLRRAVSNLLANAIAHTPPGKEIEVALTHGDDGGVRVAVSNLGPGIPASALPHVFERFFRADPARGGSHRGSGLGLAIVQSIMRLHGGSAAVESAPGGCTTVTLDFPPQPHLVEAPAPASRREPTTPSLATASAGGQKSLRGCETGRAVIS